MATGSSQYKYTNAIRQGGGGAPRSAASKRSATRSSSNSGSYDSRGNFTDSSGTVTPF